MAMMISRVARVNSSHPYLENDSSSSLVSHRLRISPWLWFRKHHTAWPCSVQRLQFPLNHYPSTQRLQFPLNHYPSTCWMVQRLTSSNLASSRWLTPFDRSTRMYPRCCSVRLGLRPGKRPSIRAFAWPETERSLIEFRHHSVKASTIESWSLPVDVPVSKSSSRDRN